MKKKIGGVLFGLGLLSAIIVGCEQSTKQVEADYNGRLEIIDEGFDIDTGSMCRTTTAHIIRDKETGAEILVIGHTEGVTSQVIKEGNK